MNRHEKLADRLSDIIIRLNQGERLNVNTLADEYKVHVRTIKRDFDRLGMLYFVETGKYYRLDKAKQGYLGIQDIHRFANFASIAELLPKLDRNFFQDKLTQSVLIKGFKYEDIKTKKKEFDAISKAIEDSSIIEFNYQKLRPSQQPLSDEKPTNQMSFKRHKLAPYRLINKNGIWYVVGLSNQKQLTFCFTQIKNLIITDESFVVDEDLKSQIANTDSLYFGNNFAEIVIQVDVSVSGYFERRDLLPNQESIKKLSNGDLLLMCKNVNPEEVIPIVQYWLPNIRVISPSEVQDKIEYMLRGYLKNKI